MLTKASLTLLLALLPSALPAQDKFALGTLLVQQSGAHQVLITVQTSGPAPSLQPADWRIVVSNPPAPDIVLPVLSSAPASTAGFDLIVDSTLLGNTKPDQVAWTINIPKLPTVNPTRRDANPPPPTPAPKPQHFFAAKGKTDADLYAFGSILAGVGTKPLYVIDAKASPAWEHNGNGWLFGLNAAIAANQSASAPVSRSKVDPDSITGAFQIRKDLIHTRQGEHAKSDIFLLDLRLPSGEFSRKYPASDLIAAGSIAWHTEKHIFHSSDHRQRAGFTFYPALGFNAGKNLNQPHQLFGQAVDLSRWNAIARLAPSATVALYALPKDNSNPKVSFPFTFTATYQPIIPFTLEPFVTTVGSGSTAIQSTSLRKNTRHEVEANAAWNFNQFVGLAVNYRYGSLPPIFQFVDQQVTIGLTFKGSFTKQN